MILSHFDIIEEYEKGKIRISPFNPQKVTTNSYDLKLGAKLLKYTDAIIDPKKENKYELIDIPDSGYLMNKGDFLLGETQEMIGSDFYVPLIHGKSGIARMGLFIHVTADIFDIGYFGKSTLQLYATLPVKLYVGMDIAQVSFWTVKGEIELYSGKYQNSVEPVASKINKEFENDTY